MVQFASPSGEVWPFLKSANGRVERDNKSPSKARDCYDVGPSVDHPRDCMRLLTAHRSILTTRNVTWQHVPSAPPATPQHLPSVAEKEESTAGEGANGEGASSQGGGRVQDLDSESDPDMAEVWPRVPPATREAPAAEPGAGVGGGGGGRQPPDAIGLPPGGTISGSLMAAVAAAVATATATTARIFPRLWGDLRGTWRFRRAPCTAKRTHEVPVAGLDHEFPVGCGEKSKKTAESERAIYGLKQSGCKWGHLCVNTLISDGFEQCKTDPCIFRNIVDGIVVMIIGVYVDDLLVEGSQDDCESFLLSLNKKFPANDLGECTWYDGFDIERNEE